MHMFEEAQRQLQPISIEQIKDILRKNIKDDFDTMIISSDAEIKRTNFIFSKCKVQKANRKLFIATFPLLNKIKNDFSFFEGGTKIFGNKSIVKQKAIVNSILKTEGSKTFKIPKEKIGNAFNHPFEIEDDEVINNQWYYFLPEYTFREACDRCSGNKYITCTDKECRGEHVWRCKECIGTGQVTCSYCKGHQYTGCRNCNESGKITRTEYRDGKSYEKSERCTKCRGKGEIPCDRCKVTGKVRCTNCDGEGKITCRQCYSDRERYGLIDCPNCLSSGSIGRLAFVETLIDDLEESKLILKGEAIEMEDEVILAYVKKEVDFSLTYKKINENIYDNNDDISSELFELYENELGLSKDDFPMVLKEEIFYQVIPIVNISYKHMLTNEIHELTILNLWDNPKVLYHSDAEKLETNIKSVSKSIFGGFSKIFKTKKHLAKEDQKTGIKLMIYLAKSDGIVEDDEKKYISEHITTLKGFTNSEKKELFNLMDLEELPELTIEDVKFNDKEKGKEIFDKLIELANADGEFEDSEKQLIEKIKSLMNG